MGGQIALEWGRSIVLCYFQWQVTCPSVSLLLKIQLALLSGSASPEHP